MCKLPLCKHIDAMLRGLVLMVLAVSWVSRAVALPIGPCKFDQLKLQFQGDASEQASCLLRHVAKWGKVDPTPASLPPALTEVIGKSTGELITPLRHLLAADGVPEAAVGGLLSKGLSHAMDGAVSAPQTKYFVIHDTSSPWVGNAPFPPDDAASVNNLSSYKGSEAVAHVFVNRKGETLTGHDFAQPWRATKLETQVIGIPAKGLFLHVELVQPRRRDPAGALKNDAVAPQPGFTSVQYEKLALLYAAASVRRGEWLIPAFHAAIDDGLSDAHDDPQNFDIEQFASALGALRLRLSSQPK